MADMARVVERIASLSATEFRRHLSLVLKGRAFTWTGELEAHLAEPGLDVTIRAEPLAPLILSPVVGLPRLRITLAYGDGAQTEAFTAAFDRAFQRGGG